MPNTHLSQYESPNIVIVPSVSFDESSTTLDQNRAATGKSSLPTNNISFEQDQQTQLNCLPYYNPCLATYQSQYCFFNNSLMAQGNQCCAPSCPEACVASYENQCIAPMYPESYIRMQQNPCNAVQYNPFNTTQEYQCSAAPFHESFMATEGNYHTNALHPGSYTGSQETGSFLPPAEPPVPNSSVGSQSSQLSGDNDLSLTNDDSERMVKKTLSWASNYLKSIGQGHPTNSKHCQSTLLMQQRKVVKDDERRKDIPCTNVSNNPPNGSMRNDKHTHFQQKDLEEKQKPVSKTSKPNETDIDTNNSKPIKLNLLNDKLPNYSVKDSSCSDLGRNVNTIRNKESCISKSKNGSTEDEKPTNKIKAPILEANLSKLHLETRKKVFNKNDKYNIKDQYFPNTITKKHIKSPKRNTSVDKSKSNQGKKLPSKNKDSLCVKNRTPVKKHIKDKPESTRKPNDTEVKGNKSLTPMKNIVQVTSSFDLNSPIVNKTDYKLEDLRSKLKRKHPTYQDTKRDNLRITVQNGNEVEKHVFTNKEDYDKATTVASNAPKLKQDTRKYKKIKLVINLEFQKCSESSESESDSKNNDYPLQANVDLSFLDDFNVDDIVDCLSPKAKHHINFNINGSPKAKDELKKEIQNPPLDPDGNNNKIQVKQDAKLIDTSPIRESNISKKTINMESNNYVQDAKNNVDNENCLTEKAGELKYKDYAGFVTKENLQSKEEMFDIKNETCNDIIKINDITNITNLEINLSKISDAKVVDNVQYPNSYHLNVDEKADDRQMEVNIKPNVDLIIKEDVLSSPQNTESSVICNNVSQIPEITMLNDVSIITIESESEDGETSEKSNEISITKNHSDHPDNNNVIDLDKHDDTSLPVNEMTNTPNDTVAEVEVKSIEDIKTDLTNNQEQASLNSSANNNKNTDNLSVIDVNTGEKVPTKGNVTVNDSKDDKGNKDKESGIAIQNKELHTNNKTDQNKSELEKVTKQNKSMTNMAPKNNVPGVNLNIPVNNALLIGLHNRMLSYFGSNYKILSLIRNGRFSKIFQCQDSRGRMCALKFNYPPSKTKVVLDSVKEDMLKLLQKDIPKNNYHCIFLIDGFGYKGNWCFLMEYYPHNLQVVLADNGKCFHIDMVQRLCRQLISAVLLLRNKQIAHLGIKPEHVLLNSAKDRLKLAGFDEAQYLDDIRILPNLGTVSYRPPEVILGYPCFIKVDVWATALVLYEMATNVKLFPGCYNNDILYKQQCTFGNMPFDMLNQSIYRSYHYIGWSFMRNMDRQKKVMIHHFSTNNKMLAIFRAYNKAWSKVRPKKARVQDNNKINQLICLLKEMLVLHPRDRLPIEFAYTNQFVYEAFSC